MAEFVEFLPGADEPIVLADVKAHCRIDADMTLDDEFITSIVIPGVRQQAETRTGSIIRQARYVQRLQRFPVNGVPIAITHGLVGAVERITYALPGGDGRGSIPTNAFEAAVIGRETLVAPIASLWPDAGGGLRAVEVTYTAGMSARDFVSRYPSVRAWMLLAAGWAYENRELFFVESRHARGLSELPEGYQATLLDPIAIRPRF
ncbi:hypothetical protein [Malikia sp.]|uniref:head-tail connector protein n=1 Tax=Malikia sp. TaxID=2070706 RepID=UPI002611E23E|nr:hypothetical protein [Malikia sp.]MDD2728177.1 hypothetical protein [Malikia sp.]